MAPNLGAVDESGAEVLLDEISTPDGPFELVAHRRQTVWIGIRRKGWPRVDGSATQSAIGLHTGSAEHYVEASVSIHGTWGLAYGGVSPGGRAGRGTQRTTGGVSRKDHPAPAPLR